MINSCIDERVRQCKRLHKQHSIFGRDYADTERRRSIQRVRNRESERPHWIVGVTALLGVYLLILCVGFLANLFLQIPGCPA